MDTIASASLKRKFDDVDVDVGSPISNSDDEISNSDSADSCDSVNPPSSTGFIRKCLGYNMELSLRHVVLLPTIQNSGDNCSMIYLF